MNLKNNYYYVEVEGKNIDRFLLKCNKNKINIYKLKYISYKKIRLLINSNDYKKLRRVNILYNYKIVNKIGIIRIKEILKKYNIFIISLIFGFLLLIFLSNIIYDIEIIGDNNNLNKSIKRELEYYKIDRFKTKKSYDYINNVKNKIKNKYRDNIEWIEIKNIGTKYIINYVERKKQKNNNDNKIYSIVATRSGVVKDIYTYNGISLVDIDSYVNKGDILISSDILLNDEIKNKIDANGKVYAETWYKVNVEYPLNYKEKKYTKKHKLSPYIKIGNNYYEFIKYRNNYRKKVISYYNNITHFEIGIEKIYEIKEYNKKYNIKEALKQANKAAKDKILLRLNNDEYIIYQNTLKFYSNGSKIIVDIFFSVYEEIGEKRIIEMGEVDDTKDIN